MIYCSARYGTGPTEYLLFDYASLGHTQRAGMLTHMKNQQLVRKFNDPSVRDIFDNKSNFNRVFQKFLHRKWIDASTSSFIEFANTVAEWDVLVCKPPYGTCGKGIEFIPITDTNSLHSIYKHIRAKGNTVVEQLVKQHCKLDEFNPLSVNTLRMLTLSIHGIHLITSYIRFSIDKQVDNFNSGGFIAHVNPSTGIIDRPGCDKKGNIYDSHPTTGSKLIGQQIPFFDEICTMLDAAAKVEPKVAYVGWDVAIATNGPLLIEGNYIPTFEFYHLPCQQECDAGIYNRICSIISGKTDEFLISKS